MKIIAIAAVLAASLPIAGSAPAQRLGERLDVQLQRARAEEAAAKAQAARLQREASRAKREADRLRIEEAAAARDVDAAEARITTANVQARLAAAYVAEHRRRLIEQQRPVSTLLVGLARMGARPPLLALADGSTVDELVKVRVLLDSTLPLIQQRTGSISAQLAQGVRLREAAIEARNEVLQSRSELDSKRRRFAALEQRALRRAVAAGGIALSAGDLAMAAAEDVEQFRQRQKEFRAAKGASDTLAALGPAPARPSAGEIAPEKPGIAYQLPAVADVVDGLAAISDNGIRSRGLTLGTARGAPVVAPADGTVRFVGPYADYDGILLIDHGGGWMSVIVNLASTLEKGDKVRLGEPVGRALGRLSVELSQNGHRVSPALIAGSSATLSKDRKGG